MPLRIITLVVSFLIGISLSLAPDKANVESRPSHQPPPRLLLQPLNSTAVANTSSVPTMVSVLGGDGDIVDISIGKVEWISHRFRCQDTHPNHAASHPCVLAKKKLASSFIHVSYIPPSSHSFADPLQEAGGSFLPAALLPPLRLAHHRRRMVSPRPRRRPAANPHAVQLHLAPTTTPGQRRPYAGHHASSLWRGLPRAAGNRLC